MCSVNGIHMGARSELRAAEGTKQSAPLLIFFWRIRMGESANGNAVDQTHMPYIHTHTEYRRTRVRVSAKGLLINIHSHAPSNPINVIAIEVSSSSAFWRAAPLLRAHIVVCVCSPHVRRHTGKYVLVACSSAGTTDTVAIWISKLNVIWFLISLERCREQRNVAKSNGVTTRVREECVPRVVMCLFLNGMRIMGIVRRPQNSTERSECTMQINMCICLLPSDIMWNHSVNGYGCKYGNHFEQSNCMLILHKLYICYYCHEKP